MYNESSNQKIINNIINLIENDDVIDHLRINIVNGCGDIFKKYKSDLKLLEDKKYVSIKLYKNTDKLYSDMFADKEVKNNNQFNLFVFNLNYCRHLCIKEDCRFFNEIALDCEQPTYCIDAMCLDSNETVESQLMKDIRGIEMIVKNLRDNFDYKFYDSVIVSMLHKNVIMNAFKEFVGEECPIKSMRYKGFDFNTEDILNCFHSILRTHSSEFLNQWESVITKLENSSNKKVI